MQWLSNIIDEVLKQHPDGEIIVSSGVSPSGKYHLGTLREVLTAEAIYVAIKQTGRQARHLHIVDDLDVFRKIPSGLSESYEKYLGVPLCDIPSPDGSNQSYADYYLSDLFEASKKLNLDMEVIRSHQKYREGFFVPAIEKALSSVDSIRQILEEISGRKLDESWTPIQVIEDDHLKNRQFLSIDESNKTIKYLDKDNQEKTVNYEHGEVKLSWRVDWPARWWLLNVQVEPFGRDHATKGGSYDTGKEIVRQVFDADPPYPVPYAFINRSGETKKMSKSSGDTITASELLDILPAEIIWYFILRFPPDKQLYFDEGEGLMKLFDEYAELSSKSNKTDQEKQLLYLCNHGQEQSTVSRVPFSHLVSSYQASLKNPDKTLEVLKRTEYKAIVSEEPDLVKKELKFIDNWLNTKAPDNVKFSLKETSDTSEFNDAEKKFFLELADVVEKAPAESDGTWYHDAIYGLQETVDLKSNEMFSALYRLLIGKTSGPRAGWFLSILPRDWLINRLKFIA